MQVLPALHRLRARFDPTVLAVGLVAAVVYLLHGLHGPLTRDLGVYAYGGQQVLDGQPPYVGILNRAGPLAHMLPALGAGASRLVGGDDIIGMRILFLALAVACVCLAYLLGRDLFASRAAGLVVATALLSFHGFIEYASYGPREKTPMVLFMLGSLYAIVHRRWMQAGFWLSLATLTLQVAFPPGLAAMVVALAAVQRSAWIGAAVRFAIGGLVPLAVVSIAYAAVGRLDDFIDGFVRLNAVYTTPNTFFANPVGKWNQASAAYGSSMWVLVVGSLALLAMSACALSPSHRRRHPQAVMVAACGAALLASMSWALRDYDGWPDAFPFLPLAAIGIGGLVAFLADRVPHMAFVAVVTTCVVVGVGAATTYAVTERSDELVTQRASVDAVFDRLPRGATMASINAPQAMALADRTNPNRIQLFTGGLDTYVEETWPGGLAGFGRSIGRNAPTVIALGLAEPPWLVDTLADYQRVGRAPGWAWYIRRSVDPDVRRAIRAALREMRSGA